MKKQYTADTLPDILTAEMISSYIGISRRRVYELFQMSDKCGGIRNFDIGVASKASKRVRRTDLMSWIDAQVNKKSHRTG